VRRFILYLSLFLMVFSPTLGPVLASTTGPTEGRDPDRQPTVQSAGMPPHPDPVRPIPRHEPGRPAGPYSRNGADAAAGAQPQAEMRSLDVLLADGTLADPLQGNYRLVDWEQILVGWTDHQNRLSHESQQAGFPDPADERVLQLAGPQVISGSLSIPGTTNALDQFGVASADLNGDGQGEQIVAWTDAAADDGVMLTVGDLPGSIGAVTSDPEPVARAGGATDLFGRGYDDGLWFRHFNGAAWEDWQALGGALASGPAAAARSSDRLDVFALGTDGLPYVQSWDGATWSGWGAVPVNPPSGVQLVGDPAAVARGPNQMDLFVRASDNSLWALPYEDGWGAWQNLGGILTSSPAVTSWGSDHLTVWGRGVDGALWHRSFDGAWGAWGRIAPPSGLDLTADPAVVSTSPGTLDVFARAADDALWQISYSDGVWSAWQSRGGELGSGPGAAALPEGGIDVFAGRPDGGLQHTTYGGGGWSAWQGLGGLPPCCVNWNTGRSLGPDNGLEVRSGYFLGNGREQIVLASKTSDGNVALATYRFPAGLQPTLMGTITTTQTVDGATRDFGIATGDLDDDGLDEIGLIMLTSPTTYVVQVFDVDPSGVPLARGLARTTHSDFTFYRVVIAAGQYMSSGKDDLAIGYTRFNSYDSSLKAFVGRVGVSEDLSQVHLYGGPLWEYSNNDNRAISIASGDLKGDRKDEFVIALPTTGFSQQQVVVLAADTNGYLSQVAAISFSGGNREYHVAVGDLNRDLVEEVVLLRQENPAEKVLDIYSFMPTSGPFGTLELEGARTIDCRCTPPNVHVALALGDVTGGSLRVGKPVYRRQSEVGGIIAVINRPPTHKDVLNGVLYDVNSQDPGTYAAYETAQMRRIGMSLQVRRDWGLSAGVETTLGDPTGTHVTASLNGTYGEHFEATTTAFETVSFGTEVKAENDDIVYYSKTDYDVWEYPVFEDNSGVPARHLAVTFPVPFAGNKATQNAFISGTSCDSWYRPNHQINNVWSYPKDGTQLKEYDDARGILNTGDQWDMASSSGAFETSWSDESVSKKTSAVNVGFSAGLEAQIGGDSVDASVDLGFVSLGKTLYTPSIKGTFEGHYSTGTVATHEMSGSDETTIRTAFASVDNAYGYKVTPHLYWSDGGYLVLDYISQPTAGTTFWDRYTRPDPAFVLPWADGSCGANNTLRSTEIEVHPPAASSGDEVTIEATVHNLSNVQANAVTVLFYLGDPASGGSAIGTSQIALLGPRARETVSIDWTASGQGEQRIYAVIDPDNAIAEMHDETDTIDNNTAYATIDLGDAAYVDPGLAPRKEYEVLTYTGNSAQLGARDSMPHASPSAVSSTAVEASVYVPLANLPETMRFELNPDTTQSFRVAGYLIDVAAYVGDEPQVTLNLRPSSEQPPGAIRIRYTDADIAGMNESNLRLYVQRGATWQDAACTDQTQHLMDENLIVVPVCETGTFALSDQAPRGSFKATILLPLVVR
jgi:hypothetical protein